MGELNEAKDQAMGAVPILAAKLTYPKVMRMHLVPYVHKVDRNGTNERVAEWYPITDEVITA